MRCGGWLQIPRRYVCAKNYQNRMTSHKDITKIKVETLFMEQVQFIHLMIL